MIRPIPGCLPHPYKMGGGKQPSPKCDGFACASKKALGDGPSDQSKRTQVNMAIVPGGHLDLKFAIVLKHPAMGK